MSTHQRDRVWARIQEEAEKERAEHAARVAEAEARGYARGVEEAAKVSDAYGPLVAKAIRALLKPKGEAK